MRLRLVLLTVLAVLLFSASASGSASDVIRDCTDDEVMSKTYKQEEYRAALRELAADADQYGNCRDVILRAQQAALAAGKSKSRQGGSSGGGGAGGGAGTSAGGGGGSSTGGGGGAGAIGSAPAAEQLSSASESERKAVEQARTRRSGPLALHNASIDPAKVGTVPGVSRAAHLPTPLIVLLALLLAGALAISGLRIRRLVDARRA